MKKTVKVFLFILTSALILSFNLSAAYANSDGISDFSVTAAIQEKKITVNWWKADDKYYLFMPSDADLSNLTVEYTASSDVTLGGAIIENGSSVSFQDKGGYTLSCNGTTYNLQVLKSANIPSLHITTESGSMESVHADKSHKEPADIVIVSDGEIAVDKELEYIKGRGNATWRYAKKPYNIKFDKKISLFGMDKAKKWSLLANFVDETMMRNVTAFDLANQAGLYSTPEYVFVDLYVNSDYYGNYLLCESVEVGDGRVEIADLEGETESVNDQDLDSYELGGNREKAFKSLKAGTQKWVNIPNNPENITGGYLLEYELAPRYIDEVSGFVTKNKQTIVLKAPEYASQAQVEYISSFYQEFEDALYAQDGYNNLGKHYTDYIDVDSFVKMYVLQETVKNFDAGLTSFFIYKDADSDKFVASPVWDFDMALGVRKELRYDLDFSEPGDWWASIIYYLNVYTAADTLPTVLNLLYRHDDFFALACKEWQSTFAPYINEEYLDSIALRSQVLTPSGVMNAIRWEYFDSQSCEDVALAYKDKVDNTLINFIKGRKNFLEKGFSDNSVRIFYDANSGKGRMFQKDALVKGESLTLAQCAFTHDSMIFDCWNTKADGSGEKYNPGDVLELKDSKVTLYARWKEKPAEPDKPTDNTCNHICHKTGFVGFLYKIIRFFWKLFKMNPVCDCGVAHY